MKNFFSKSFPWQSPLKIFPVLEENFSAQLLYSGTTAGKFSYIPFIEKKSEENAENFFTLENFADYTKMQKKFFYLQAKNFPQEGLKNWDFPFCGGLVGAFEYERWKGEFFLAEKFFIFDHHVQNFFLAGWFQDEKQWGEFLKKIEDIVTVGAYAIRPAHNQQGVCNRPLQKNNKLQPTKFFPQISQETYKKNFQTCQDEIEKGNSFQINYSQKFSAITEHSAWEIFVAATQKNPAPMMYFSPCSRKKKIISCSPERLFSIDKNGKIFTQPIAGTRPRGKNDGEEHFLENELKNSKKEMAEHSMIVDLLRNDMGKISLFGSVEVIDFARIEKYKTVMHLVSDIVGNIAPDKNFFEVLESFFPGGTITGTPKSETIKILERVEKEPRGYYCGSAGYFSLCGSADWNILIRTFEKQEKNIWGRAGGGLVHGADPEAEYLETLQKFKGMEKIFS